MSRSQVLDPSKLCIYCGKPVKGVRKGEHIVPEALGGAATIPRVCSGCNSGTLSQLDKELVSRSPLSVLVWEELGRTQNEVWDYDVERDLALEARVEEGYLYPVLWPQIILDEERSVFRADVAEVQELGWERSVRVFDTHLLAARKSLDSGAKRPLWIWEPRETPPDRGRYPPRVFCRRRISQLNPRSHFQCRYLRNAEQGDILRRIDTWCARKGQLVLEQTVGVRDPEAHLSWSPRYVVRALVKIALNTLASICKNTLVIRDTFPEAVRFVLDEEGGELDWRRYGFVVNEDIAFLECPKGAHRLDLTYGAGWSFVASFFGGRAGAFVNFPGPNSELWSHALVTLPLKSPKVSLKTSRIVVPRVLHVESVDWRRVIPSVPASNVRGGVTYRRRRKR